MKQKSLNKKLRLRKSTVSNLNNLVLARINGGNEAYPTAKAVHTCNDGGEGYCNETGGGEPTTDLPPTNQQTQCSPCPTYTCGDYYPTTDPMDGPTCSPI